jgi:molybdenum cofactor guanylyltransferase
LSARPPLYGLVLAGGRSERMQRDKAALIYDGTNQLQRAIGLLERYVHPVFISVRPDQVEDPARQMRPQIVDTVTGSGPIVGIRSALAAKPGVAWLVMACDLPFLSGATLAHLIAERDAEACGTAYRSAHDGLPEPLCAIWEPRSAALLDAHVGAGGTCPRKFLIRNGPRILQPLDARALDNVNTPEEYQAARAQLETPSGGHAH